jgi:hypothetical protein
MQLMPLSVCGQAKSIRHKAGGNEHGQHAGKETASIAAASPAGGPQDCPSEKGTRPIAEPPVQGNERKSRLTKNRRNCVVCRMCDRVTSRFRKRCLDTIAHRLGWENGALSGDAPEKHHRPCARSLASFAVQATRWDSEARCFVVSRAHIQEFSAPG